jgi:hypothetical protein
LSVRLSSCWASSCKTSSTFRPSTFALAVGINPRSCLRVGRYRRRCLQPGAVNAGHTCKRKKVTLTFSAQKSSLST